ncbi:hypothetical protein Q7P37_006429 [Cladosporium fusiforme]
METLHPKAGFASQTSLSGHTAPATPPYTPAKHKRRFERSDSPASSINPTETSSPAKKVLKRTESDTILVIELPDGDLDDLDSLDGAEVEVVSPAELEEVEDYPSESQDDTDDSDDSDSGISSRFEKLNCSDREEESEMTKKRRERRLSKRTGSRVFKRPHSQSANSDTEVTDTDAADSRSRNGSVKRLRRRVHDVLVGSADLEEWRSSPEPSGRRPAEQRSEPIEGVEGDVGDGASRSEAGNDQMEV